MKRVLVTGGAGFIGSYTVDTLVQHGYAVRILDSLDPQVHPRRDPPSWLNPEAELLRGDVIQRQSVEAALQDVDAVLHLAAAVGVGQSMYQIGHYMHVNAGGTALLLDVLANTKHQVRKLVVAASMSSYGEGAYSCNQCGLVRPRLRQPEDVRNNSWEPPCPKCGGSLAPVPTAEDAVQNVNSVYAISKKCQEELVLTVGRAYDIPAVALRYFNVYGPRQSLSNPYTGVLALFLSRLKSGNPPFIYEDGLQTRDFVSVHDVAHANLLALETDAANYHAINIGSGGPRTIVSVAQELARSLGLSLEPEVSGRFRKGDVRHCYADITKARTLLGWEPRVSFAEGMKELIQWSRRAASWDGFEQATQELTSRGLA